MREWLVRSRKHCEMTTYQAAEKAGISQSYYAAIENGERQADMSLSIMQKLAKVFGITVDDIVQMETEHQKEKHIHDNPTGLARDTR